ncbi:MAG TPA: helix-turn-helix domain-containing protein [Gemmatimonadaceae bacterium]|nr:helix-turn-helix domain-containing protein [Gemmatimonadaceae bacterium]
MKKTRAYHMRKRAEGKAETSRRIIEATSELHRTVGPAAATISEIARRAGVQRVTIYEHFPDEAALFAACSAHWRALHPAPDPAAWLAIAVPRRRRRRALHDLYAWFRETAPMTGNVLRDAERLPALRAIVERGLGAYLERVQALLAEDLPPGRRSAAAARVAANFHTWQALAPLGDAEAAERAAEFVERASRPARRLRREHRRR